MKPEQRGELHTAGTLGQVILSAIARFPDRKAIGDDHQTWTYGQLGEWIGRAITVLEALGLRAGDGMAILSANRVEVIAVQYAAVLMGVRYTALHPLAAPDTHAFIANDAEISALVFDPASVSYDATELKAKAGALQHILSFGPSNGAVDLIEAMEKAAPRPLQDKGRGDETAFLYYTGGTTGVPKGVMLPHRSLVTLTVLQASDWDLPEPARFLALTPISHASGVIVPTVFLKGGYVRLIAGFTTAKFCKAVREEEISLTFLVPTMIYALLDDPAVDRKDLRSLQTVLYGAAPIAPHRLATAVQRFGPVFMQLYGQTEAPMCVTTLRKSDHEVSRMDRLGSCGLPSPLVQVKLFDRDMREVDQGVPGEICVRGPLVMDCYWKRDDATREAFHGGWLHTGDVAIRSPDGYLTIVDRTRDMIISGGFNIYPSEVEEALLAHPGVALAAVIGSADEKWGEAVVAYVVPRAEGSVDEPTLKAHVKARRGSIWSPKAIYFVQSIPLTALGKIDRKAVRALHAQRRAPDTSVAVPAR